MSTLRSAAATPAKRMQTQSRLYGKIAEAIRFVAAHHDQQPELQQIARHIGMSADHLQRTFGEWAGISPKKFLKSVTLAAAKQRLAASESVMDAAFDTGLSGPGRLHDLFVTTDAVTPGEFKARGAGMTLHYGFHPSPFGECLIVTSARGMTGLSFVTSGRAGALAEQRQGWENAAWREDAAATAPLALQAFDGAGGDLRLLLRGSKFRIKVWEALLRIPDGHVTTYGGLAARLGQPSAARAVAGAVAGNLIGYVIPCHRVIRESGALSGYRWDPVRKSAILAYEAGAQGAAGLETAAANP